MIKATVLASSIFFISLSDGCGNPTTLMQVEDRETCLELGNDSYMKCYSTDGVKIERIIK